MRDSHHPETGRLTASARARPDQTGVGLALRHRLEYSALLAARELFRHLPPDRAVALGAAIGSAYALLGGPRTGVAAINLELAFPDKSDAERRQLLVASFANLGRCIADVFVLQGRHRDALFAGVSVEGIEHYETARAQSPSGGVIVVTAHFGSWELCGAAMSRMGYPLSVVHHDVRNPYLDAMVSRWRSSAGTQEIRLGRAAIGVLRALARGRLAVLLLDQNAHRDESVFAPLFGRAALTRFAPASIAMKRSLPVLPVFIFREGTTSRHVVKLFPSLELEESGDDDAADEAALTTNVARINAAIEAAIRLAPDHWLWAHRRFKTRPAGEPAIYPSRRRQTRRRG